MQRGYRVAFPLLLLVVAGSEDDGEKSQSYEKYPFRRWVNTGLWMVVVILIGYL